MNVTPHSPARRLFIAGAFFVALASSVFAEFNTSSLNKVTVRNRTDATIRFLFVSPGDSSYWGPDLLGSSNVIARDADYVFHIHYPERTGKFDVLAIDDKNNRYQIDNVLIEDGEEKIIVLKQSDFTRNAAMSLVKITVENATRYRMYYLFVSPGDSGMWGADLLGLSEQISLASEDTFSFFIPASSEPVKYDVKAVDGDRDSYTFSVSVDNHRNEYSLKIEASDFDR